MNRFNFNKALLLLSISCTLAVAQIDRTTIAGRVTDPAGLPVPGSTITAIENNSGLKREVTTGTAGEYSMPALPAGSYKLTATKTGFRTVEIADVTQTVGSTRTLDIQLELATASASVVVAAGAPALDASSATLGGTVDPIQAEEIPLNGRNWATLSTQVPGAVDTGDGSQKSIRFSGHGNDDTNFRLDGVDFTGIQNQAPKSALRLQVSTEAIQEFKVATSSYTVENGGSAGGQVNIVSKSGSNILHGSLFEYLRNNDFDARNPFNHAPAPQPPFHLNQFGGSLGGALRKDKTFFFVNYEGFRQSLGLTQVGVVPSATLKSQIISAQPALAPVLNAYPAGTGPVANLTPALQGLVQQYVGTTSTPVREDAAFIRVDHRFSDKDTAYARYNIDDGSTTSPLGSLNATTTVNPQLDNGLLEHLHIFSSTLVNEARAGFNRNYFPQSQTTGLPYNFSIPGISNLSDNYTKIQASNSFDYRDDLTWTPGKHTFKAGVEVRRVQINEGNSADGTVSFASSGVDGFNDLRADRVNTFAASAPLPTKGLRKTQSFFYLQDEWKVAPDMTVTYGIRYNYFGPFSEVENRAYPFDLASCEGYCAKGSAFTFANTNDFDPRVSLAWSPKSLHANTVFRAGYGVYHGETQLGDQDAPVVNDQPAVNLQTSSTLLLSYPINPSLIPLTGLAVAPRSLARYHPDSYVQNWTASVQQLLPARVILTVAYSGAKGTDLFQRTYSNAINPLTGTRPLAPAFPGQIDLKTDEGNSNFNALQASAKRHFHSGLFLSANFQWSHAIDDGTAGSGDAVVPQSAACIRCERASSAFDVRETGNISSVYQLPFGAKRRISLRGPILNALFGGWEISNVLAGRSGLPLNITITRTGSSVPDGNTTNQRPDLVPGASIYPVNQNASNWLNPAAFQQPKAGTFGNAPRDLARGPILWQDDAAIDKDVQITERMRLNIRGEAFNIFNRAQYGSPNTNVSNLSAFGQIQTLVNTSGLTGSGTPRNLQIALRLSF